MGGTLNATFRIQCTVEVLTALGMAMGASWIAGYRLYACVGVLGLAGYYDVARLPGQLEVLTDPRVFVTAVILFVVEFLADKIPWLDSGWDAVHTFIRIPAGAVLAAVAFADFDPWLKVVAGLIGGGIALSAHGTKAATRVVVNHSPEPVSNVATSLTEDAVAGVSLAMLIWVPLAMIGLVSLALLTTWLLVKRARRMKTERKIV